MTADMLIGALGLVVILAFVLGLGMGRLKERRLLEAQRTQAPLDPGPPTVPGVASATTEAPRTLEQIGEALAPAYQASDHPEELLQDPAFVEGVARLADASVPLATVVRWACGDNREVAVMAAEALAQRTDSGPAARQVAEHLRYAYVWTTWCALRYIDKRATEPLAAKIVARIPEFWSQNPIVAKALGDFLDARRAAGERPDLIATLKATPPDAPDAIRTLLQRITSPVAAELLAQFDEWRATRFDPTFLSSVGAFMETGGADGVIEHAELAASAETLARHLLEPRPRSVIVVGEAGVGKSVLVGAVARRLAREGWVVFEANATDVNAGMTYIGELEERMRRLLDALSARRKVVWYAPNLHELYYAGRHKLNPTGILDLVMPAVEAGKLAMIGESQPALLEKVLRERPRLRGAFAMFDLAPMSPDRAAEIATALVPANAQPRPDVFAREAIDLARHYLATRQLPGSVCDLIRETVARCRDRGGAIGRDDLIETLASLTGLPREVLDERTGIDPAGLRRHFAARVKGQPEAVDALVDRIAMLKAGLTDPARPVGVFLFAGPTGTGKTEVAKTLATYLFGDADRMIRIDMSELQDPGSMARIVGDGDPLGGADALVNRVRKQPFSVVLLDEFEKAHPRIWDLFLQVFDDGRLTDALGSTVDFRHTIIILTSNLGATLHQGSSLGFTGGASSFAEAQVMRTIGQTFRPEFVNRIDRVVVFRPLSRGVMRDILVKELGDVLGRRGFRTRDWAVEWEASAIEFLLDRGFTPDMGARPLRRAIDQYVLAPIAMTIAENRHPEGDQFLFVRSDGRAIEVAFVDPDAPAQEAALEPTGHETAEPASTEVTLARLLAGPRAVPEERRFLEERFAAIEARIGGADWLDMKDALFLAMNGDGFWESAGRFRVVDRVERVDHIEAGARSARALLARLATSGGRRATLPPMLLASIAGEIMRLEAALADLDDDVPGDAFVAITAVAGDAGSIQEDARWVASLASMYTGWASRRGMRARALGDRADEVVLSISGLGARRLLAGEAGLHLLEHPLEDGSFRRHSARVQVVAQPVTPKPRDTDEQAYALAVLASDHAQPAVVRRYRDGASPLVRDAIAGWRTGRLDRVLAGEFDAYAV